uniref:UBC core domain-containing protein n=1 Tax=Bionectria ochroleuca TaxID=29856 RepID=A0A0B7K0N6_BIOOC
MNLPSEYPIKPLDVTLNARIYHPNISSSGKIFIDILGPNWSPSLTVEKVCSMLNDPNPDDCLVPEAGRLYRVDRQSYNDKARSWTRKYVI